MGALYGAECGGTTAALPPLTRQYRDYATARRDRLHSKRGQADREYWLAALKPPLPALSLPTDLPRPPVRTQDGHSLDVAIGDAQATEMHLLAKGEGATLFSMLLSLVAILLHRLTGDNDIVIGIPVADRPDRASEGVIGLYAETQAIRVRLSSGR